MSSFNVNGPSNRPIIQESQSMQNNGGGGNLGYFKREHGEEDAEFVPQDMSDMFEKEDTFEREGEEKNTKKTGFFAKIINFFKKMFYKLFAPKPQKIQKDEFLTLSKK